MPVYLYRFVLVYARMSLSVFTMISWSQSITVDFRYSISINFYTHQRQFLIYLILLPLKAFLIIFANYIIYTVSAVYFHVFHCKMIQTNFDTSNQILKGRKVLRCAKYGKLCWFPSPFEKSFHETEMSKNQWLCQLSDPYSHWGFSLLWVCFICYKRKSSFEQHFVGLGSVRSLFFV